jgi:hypothetical protein
MDIFDSDAYFGRQFPFKAKQNSMLRDAIAAVAARQIAQMISSQSFGARLGNLSSLSMDFDKPTKVDWYYKAANYYDAGIAYLRLHLQRCCAASSPSSVVAQSPAAPPLAAHPASEKYSTESASLSRTIYRTDAYSPSPGDAEDLLSAIAVFSLYESFNGYTGEWKQ